MPDRAAIQQAILTLAGADERIVGVVDYGSSARGQSDAWSDLDLVLFIRDGVQAAFAREWKSFAEAAGPLLLAYAAGEHPRAVYDTRPAPLRVDFAFYPASRAAEVKTWKNVSPTRVDAMVLLDREASLSEAAGGLVGARPAAPDLAATYEHVQGDLWNYLLRVYALAQRGEWLCARAEYHWYVLDNLAALMRLEVGDLGRWRLGFAMKGLETVVRPGRMRQLEDCVPGSENQELYGAAAKAADLGRELCQRLCERTGWSYPVTLHLRIAWLLRDAMGLQYPGHPREEPPE